MKKENNENNLIRFKSNNSKKEMGKTNTSGKNYSAGWYMYPGTPPTECSFFYVMLLVSNAASSLGVFEKHYCVYTTDSHEAYTIAKEDAATYGLHTFYSDVVKCSFSEAIKFQRICTVNYFINYNYMNYE